jgi:nicotinic acid mononucleotide adenylyltransferase
MKIGILIPSTSNNRDWKSYKESYLYIYTLKTFLLTYDKEHEYVFYIGIDRGDKIYDNPNEMRELHRFLSVMQNVKMDFVYMDNIPKGHLTKMWNRLYSKAYSENCDYFFQCGDDICFRTNGWINDCIKTIISVKDLGMTGPINNNPNILTQTFVSRKHMEMFGYYFPEEIINWYCDDWINQVYKSKQLLFPLLNHFCENLGGSPRYHINNDPNYQINSQKKRASMESQCSELVKRDVKKIDTFHKI